ncbi:hypothetical protein M513_14064 [Trichuris suis]|uniref:Uncharacterized protein n=1 Tax=Trichuris suis TaxID=68888 RepID=A0A085LJB3_9BILA|nr:hypothetical protein M513_14064 [Trichuris suis]
MERRVQSLYSKQRDKTTLLPDSRLDTGASGGLLGKKARDGVISACVETRYVSLLMMTDFGPAMIKLLRSDVQKNNYFPPPSAQPKFSARDHTCQCKLALALLSRTRNMFQCSVTVPHEPSTAPREKPTNANAKVYIEGRGKRSTSRSPRLAT